MACRAFPRARPSLFYQWQRLLFDNLAGALERVPVDGPSQKEKKLGQRIEFLEARLARKDSVIAEISAEYVQLKKVLGEL